MDHSFDPYRKWLGIPPSQQPPNHYRLLGLELFESDSEVIDAAASRQVAYLQGWATGPHVAYSQRLLSEVATARLCLLNPVKKAAYDAGLTLTQDPAALSGTFDDLEDPSFRVADLPVAPRAPQGGRMPRQQFGTSHKAANPGRRKKSVLGSPVVRVVGLVVSSVLVLGLGYLIVRPFLGETHPQPATELNVTSSVTPSTVPNAGIANATTKGRETGKPPEAPKPLPVPKVEEPKPQPGPKVESVPTGPPQEKLKWLPLADTWEQFQGSWRQGDQRGNFFFDAPRKTINIDGVWDLGGLTCPRKWKEFYCEIDVSYLSHGNFDLAVKRSRFKLGNALGKVPVTASLRVKLDDQSRNAVVLLNGVHVGQASILDPTWLDSFDCTFSSNGGGHAKLALRNIHLLVLSSDSEVLSDWTPPVRSVPAKPAQVQNQVYKVERSNAERFSAPTSRVPASAARRKSSGTRGRHVAPQDRLQISVHDAQAFGGELENRFPMSQNKARDGVLECSNKANGWGPKDVFLGSRTGPGCNLRAKGRFVATWAEPPTGRYILIFARTESGSGKGSDAWGAASISVNKGKITPLMGMACQSAAIIDVGGAVPIQSIDIVINGEWNPGIAGLEIHAALKKR